MVKRGDVWLTALDPTRGSEIQKTRPCVVISPDDLHSHLRTAMIAPMTSANRPARFRVPVRFQSRDGLILLDQIRVIDKVRMLRRLGEVDDVALALTLAGLRNLFEE